MSISQSEKEYISRGCSEGIRSDGRGALDFRHFTIESDIFPHCSGSARVRVALEVDLVCTTKVELLDVTSTGDHDNEDDSTTVVNDSLNVVEYSVVFSPSTNMKADERTLDEQGSNLARRLQNICVESKSIDAKVLCIIPGKYYWKIHVDILIFTADGDPLDVCSIASYLALGGTRVPRTELSLGEKGEPDDFAITGDLYDSDLLDVSNLPLAVSLSKVGNALVVDATSAELACSSFSMTVAVDRREKICHLSKNRGGTAPPGDIMAAMATSTRAAAAIFSILDGYMAKFDQGSSNECADVLPPRRGYLS